MAHPTITSPLIPPSSFQPYKWHFHPLSNRGCLIAKGQFPAESSFLHARPQLIGLDPRYHYCWKSTNLHDFFIYVSAAHNTRNLLRACNPKLARRASHPAAWGPKAIELLEDIIRRTPWLASDLAEFARKLVNVAKCAGAAATPFKSKCQSLRKLSCLINLTRSKSLKIGAVMFCCTHVWVRWINEMDGKVWTSAEKAIPLLAFVSALIWWNFFHGKFGINFLFQAASGFELSSKGQGGLGPWEARTFPAPILEHSKICSREIRRPVSYHLRWLDVISLPYLSLEYQI